VPPRLPPGCNESGARRASSRDGLLRRIIVSRWWRELHQVLDSDPVIFRHEGGGDPRTAVARELAGGRSEVNRLSGNSRPRAASAWRQGIRGPPRDHVL